MKKLLIATGVAVLAIASVAAAQGYSFNTNLTVGSTGADVSALQTWLIGAGYNIPSIASGAASKGYFGAQTKAAVEKFQAAKDLPATGFVGPLTRGVLNGSSVAMTTTSVSCPAGYTCTATAPVNTTCPAGYSCTANTSTTPAAAPTVITTPGVSGTLSIASSGSVGVGATVNAGQSVDIAGFKLQAGPSDMQVNTMTVDFNVRPWLYFTDFSLVNQTTGQVLVPATAISQANFTEITASQDYRYTLSGLNFVVPHGQTVNVVLHGDMVPSTGQAKGYINVITAQLRSVDGTGVVDTETLNPAACANTSPSPCGSVYFSGTLQANLIFSLDSTSPLSQVIQTQSGASTNAVPLAVYDVQAQNSAATLQSLTMNIGVNGTTVTPTSVYSSIQLQAPNGLTYYGTIANNTTGSTEAGTISFTNMNIPLPLLQNVPLKVIGSVASGVTAVTSTTSIATGTASPAVVLGIVGGVDSSFNTPTVQGNGTVSSAVITYSTNSAITVTPGVQPGTPGNTCQLTTSNNSTVGENCTYTFTVSAGASPLYISANPIYAVATTSNLTGAAASTTYMTQVTAVGNSLPQDVAGTGSGATATGSFVVPSNSSRTFNVAAQISNAGNTANNSVVLTINGVYYAINSTITSNTIGTAAGNVAGEYMSGLANVLTNSPITLSH